jgi:DNA processing protein
VGRGRRKQGQSLSLASREPHSRFAPPLAPPASHEPLEEDLARSIAAGDLPAPDVELSELRRALEARRIHLLGRSQADFPAQLRDLGEESPPLLYCRTSGDPAELLAGPLVAIVGARASSSEGRRFAEELARELAGNGVAVLSGLGRGIEVAATKAAVASQGRVVVVFGCGIDRIFPAAYSDLALEVERRGALVSAYGPGILPSRERFEARFRLIAALASVVVVVEGRTHGGALFVAEQAWALGRPLFAWPGGANPPVLFEPVRALIAEGKARPLEGAGPVLELLGLR